MVSDVVGMLVVAQEAVLGLAEGACEDISSTGHNKRRKKNKKRMKNASTLQNKSFSDPFLVSKTLFFVLLC